MRALYACIAALCATSRIGDSAPDKVMRAAGIGRLMIDGGSSPALLARNLCCASLASLTLLA